jgi:hypothetical protein
MTAVDSLENIAHLREKDSLTWHQIGETTGLTAETARQRYRRYKKTRDLQEDPGILAAAQELGLGDKLKLKGGWLKSDTASLRFETPNESHDDNAVEEYANLIKSALTGLPTATLTPAPLDLPEDILARYILTDLHGGMAAQKAVSGEDYNLDIAAERLRTATRRLALATEASHTAIIANLGDVFHANDSKKMTFHSGHILDMVTQSFPQIALQVTLAVIEMIEILKTKHAFIRYIGIPGNHDVDQAYWLTIALMMHFKDDPRVSIEWHVSKLVVDKPFGRNLFAYHHGERVTFQQLANQVADKYAEYWGLTNWRYIDTGHVHHDRAKEIGGVMCESHRTLASIDAAAYGFGYTGRQTAKSIVYHLDRGEITRHTASFG